MKVNPGLSQMKRATTKVTKTMEAPGLIGGKGPIFL